MHASFPCFPHGLHTVMKLGFDGEAVTRLVDRAGGRLMASGMSLLLKVGFAFLLRDGLLDDRHSQEALAFFDENFVIHDPDAPGGQRYYQGKFLIRTRKPDDDMNVWLRFCPHPDALFDMTPEGPKLNSSAVVWTETLDEAQAEALEHDLDQVDLVIRFRDVESILNLLGRTNVDLTGLLLENVVQLSGNLGHLFKLGAIARNIELTLDLPVV